MKSERRPCISASAKLRSCSVGREYFEDILRREGGAAMDRPISLEG